MMPRCARSKRQAGFTLVEVLVSLVVVAMAAVLLTIGIGRIGLELGLSQRGDARLDTIATAQFELRQRIERTYPVKDPQTGNTVDFSGTEKSLDFLGEAPGNVGPDALQRYRVKIARDGTLTLYRLSTLSTTANQREASTDGWQATPLVTGVHALGIRYFGPTPENTGNQWQPYWVHRATLPRLVRLTLDFNDGDARGWPDLVIRVHAAGSDNCDRDLRTDECKGQSSV